MRELNTTNKENKMTEYLTREEYFSVEILVRMTRIRKAVELNEERSSDFKLTWVEVKELERLRDKK